MATTGENDGDGETGTDPSRSSVDPRGDGDLATLEHDASAPSVADGGLPDHDDPDMDSDVVVSEVLTEEDMTDDEWETEGLPVKEHGPRGQLKFDSIRVDGFKSFPDRAEMAVEEGMTGVVGPNGCGKSNLLECLRWVAGETSAKRMRGGGMDDVIFGGTDRRPPRNVAEVTLVVDNRSRTAPPAMNDADVLEITRRIERGQGTSYRVNGKPTRLRDVQILFQDNAFGANSSAIVSQGRVGSLINAKPSERKSVLEEAAGVSGLASRRHDTVLKLNGTETNLNRAEDALLQSSETLTGLRKQARQAARRREIDGKIREAGATVLLVRRLAADSALATSAADHEANEAKVAEAIMEAKRTTEARDAASAALPALRSARDVAESARARAVARVEGLSQETERNRKEVDEISRRLIELGADRKREEDTLSEAETALRKLGEERMVIVERREDESIAMENASDTVEEVRQQVEAADALVAKLAGEVATREANHVAALRNRDDAARRLEAVEAKLAECEARLTQARAASPVAEAATAASVALAETEGALTAMTEALAEAEDALTQARETESSSQVAATEATATMARLRAEAGGLESAASLRTTGRPVSDVTDVEAGYEAAVAAAFGDALGYGVEAGETASWTGRPAPVPDGMGESLAEHVTGPLAAPAKGILVVSGDRLAALVSEGVPFGFVAVTKAGRFARWDGLNGRLRTDAVENALRRANRLKALLSEIATHEATVTSTSADHVARKEATRVALEREATVRAEQRRALAAVGTARDALSRLDREGEEARRRVAVTESEVAAARAARQEATVVLSGAADALASIPPDDEARQAHVQARRKQSERREAEGKARVALERIVQEANQRRARFDAVLREESATSQRRDQAKARRADLGLRTDEAEAALKDAQERPASSPAAVEEAATHLAEAETIARTATDALQAGENARDATEQGSRTADSTLAVLREARARTIGAIDAAQQASRAVDASIRERMTGPDETPPDAAGLAAIAKVDPNATLDLQASEARLSRLERERETLGAVNFLAESELAEQEKRYGDIERSREELRKTLKALRQAIDEIDREARAKLEEAFRKIDASFGELFVTLFSGGEAHLRLVGSEDILSAGLEIYASPPGKRLQVLSLLSGGEQALTAMALIFASFLSNPAPICVLDEVDAPLDDANADRLCRLVEAMTPRTRFLVVTHNPLTMARMNRLYGVTMGEQGVSTLTRVDLDKAMEFADKA